MPGGRAGTGHCVPHGRRERKTGPALATNLSVADGGRPPRGSLGRIRRALLAMSCCPALLMLSAGMALAQDRSESGQASALGAATIVGPSPRLELPSVIIGTPESETSLGIAIGRDGALPANSYIRIRGLSPSMSLTGGHVIAPGAWAVPIGALPDLRVVIPAGATGKTDVHVALVAIDGGVVTETHTTLIVTPTSRAKTDTATGQPPPETPPKDVPSQPAPTAPSAPTADRDRAADFLARGRKLLASGDIASARLFFRRAADAGLADGALAMGDTFDPLELNRLNAIGIRPDPDEARRWYERARELGAGTTADRRLERLGAQ